MRIRLVTINGPLGVGKTWIVNQLFDGIKADHMRGVVKRRVSWQDSLVKSVRALLGVHDSVHYADFKKSLYYGKTGRQWLIDMSEDFCKKYDPMFFSRVMHEAIKFESSLIPGTHRQIFFFADSNGFEHELMYFRTQPEIDILACCIEPPGLADRGALWRPDDSRFNLAHLCEVVGPDSTTVLQKMVDAMQRRGWV